MALFQQGMFQINPRDTPETIARKRALANQIMNGPAVAPRSTADGIGNMFGAIMGGIAARNMNNKADAAERAGQESAASAFNPLLDAFRSRTGLDANGFPAAPNPGDSTSMAEMPAPDYASARVAQAHGDSGGGFNGDLRSGIIATAEAIGADPLDLATAISYETAGTFDPTKRGPRTQWGQHRGLIQFGEPQARQHGVDWNDPLGSQLGPNGAIASYFRSSGFKPGMSGLDLYSTINAGAPGRYRASDANNGGAPGNVRDKWENQMAGHRRKAAALLGSAGLPAAPAAPASASSLTPEALQSWAFANYGQNQQSGSAADAVNALGEAQPVGLAETEADILAQEQAMMAQDPQAFQQPGAGAPQAAAGQYAPLMPHQPAPPLPDPRMVQDMPVAPMQVAQAGGFPEMAGRNPQAIPAPGIDMQMIANVLTNPFSNPEQRAFAQMLLEQEMQSRDPMRQLQLEKGQLEIDALRNPQPKDTDDIREYNYARQQGYQGSFQQFMTDMKRAGATNVTTMVGGNSSEFAKESDKAAAGRMNDYVTQGAQAGQMMSDMQQLLDLGAQIGTGKEAELKAALGPYAQMLGVEIDGLGEAQAFKSITDRLAPQMRPVGAGSSSDRDVAMYLNSLPNLRNSPEGNTIIANTMRGLAQNKMQAAEIAAQAQMGEITWQEAEKQIRALPNPYENFKQFMKQTGPRGKTSGGIQWSIEE